MGYFVTQRLLDKGVEVYGIDNLNAYYDVALKRDRLAQLKTHNALANELMAHAYSSLYSREM